MKTNQADVAVDDDDADAAVVASVVASYDVASDDLLAVVFPFDPLLPLLP